MNPLFSPGMKHFLTLIVTMMMVLASGELHSQVMIKGGVFDSTRLIPVPAVKVKSTSGAITYTDSSGQYKILVNLTDSINFTYKEKSTNWFAVKDIRNYDNLDIALQVRLQDRYQTLKEVIVISKSHRQDSVENREKYAKVFGYSRPGLQINESNALYGGTPGFDPNELINLFRFKRNKSLKKLQNRLLEEEARKFVDYRFNKTTVKNLTKLEGEDLRRFMYYYRPSYDFTAMCTDYQFYEYILEASKLFRQGIVPPEQNINN